MLPRDEKSRGKWKVYFHFLNPLCYSAFKDKSFFPNRNIKMNENTRGKVQTCIS